MTKGEKILAVAARDIGYHQDANGHNKYGEWFGLDCVPFCMEAVQYWYHFAGFTLPYKTPSCGALLKWYQKNDPDSITNDPVPGCIVIFDFAGTGSTTDHTGLFVSKTDLKITTIDGNTSATNQSNGGWVQQKTRSITFANPTYIVPRELEDDMTIEQFIRDVTPAQLQQLVEKMDNETCYTALLKANEHAGSLATPKWMESELDAAVAAGITDGSRPLATCMRGQAAMMTYRAMNSIKKAAGLPYESIVTQTKDGITSTVKVANNGTAD